MSKPYLLRVLGLAFERGDQWLWKTRRDTSAHAEDAATIALALRGFRQTIAIREPVVRIMHIIPEILKRRAVKLIRSGARDNRNLRAWRALELWRKR